MTRHVAVLLDWKAMGEQAATRAMNGSKSATVMALAKGQYQMKVVEAPDAESVFVLLATEPRPMFCGDVVLDPEERVILCTREGWREITCPGMAREIEAGMETVGSA